jgi:hypothetical protein
VGSHIRGMSLLWQGGAAARGAHQRRVAGALQREAPARLLRKRAHRCEHVDQAGGAGDFGHANRRSCVCFLPDIDAMMNVAGCARHAMPWPTHANSHGPHMPTAMAHWLAVGCVMAPTIVEGAGSQGWVCHPYAPVCTAASQACMQRFGTAGSAALSPPPLTPRSPAAGWLAGWHGRCSSGAWAPPTAAAAAAVRRRRLRGPIAGGGG